MMNHLISRKNFALKPISKAVDTGQGCSATATGELVSSVAFKRACVTTLSVLLLSACFNEEQVELKQWMQAQRAKTPATILPINVPVKFVNAPYTQLGSTDPFDDQKLKNVLAKLRSNTVVSSIQPDLSRKREFLEAYPLDSVKMTGFILKQGKPSALVSTPNGLFTVVVGNYLGQDFGKVVALSEQELTLKELVQDGSGSWAERVTKVSLQAALKDGKK